MRQQEAFRATHDALTDEGREDSRRELVDACQATTDPGEIELLRCNLAAKTPAGLEACLEPHRQAQTLRYLRAEGKFNLAGIRTAEAAYHAEHGTYMACDPTPPEIAGPDRVTFTGGGKEQFQTMGFRQYEPVGCRYSVVLTAEGGYQATAECDADGDGVLSIWRATESAEATLQTPEDVY